MQESTQKQIQDMLQNLQNSLTQKPPRKNLEAEVNKDLKKIKHIISITKCTLSEQFKKSVNVRQKKIRQTLDKIKPVVYLSPQEKIICREQIIGVIKLIEKKVAGLDEKKGNKKRQANIQFFKQHLGKLSMFAQWLNSPSRKFPSDITKQLLQYIKDLQISHDDSIFQEDLKAIYDKIIASANQPAELSHNLFLLSYQNRPKINDYLLTKQTKQILPRNLVIPQYKMIDLSVIPKMDRQVLFFMFYYHKGDTQQYLAAKQLMKRSWRFYKKFNVWLRRNSTPTFEGASYESGKYISMNSELHINYKKENIKVYHNSLLKNL